MHLTTDYRTAAPLALLAIASLTTACGAATRDIPNCNAASQDEALDCLGVPEDDSARADRTGQPLPDSYSPLGPTKTVGASMELFMVGMQIAPPTPVGEGDVLDNRAVLVELTDDPTGGLDTTVLDAQPPGTKWEHDSRSGHPSAQTTRAAAGPDLDGDGIDEIVVAYLDVDDPVNEGVVFFEIVNVAAPQIVVTVPDARDVVLERIDVDGDGADELALGVATAEAGYVFIVDRDAADRFYAVEAATKTMPRITTTGGASIELASGNLDRDNGEELAAVLNELNSNTSGTTTYSVFDDASTGYAALAASESIRVQDDGSFEAKVADVTLGDVDADGVDELVFAGLSELLGDTCTAYHHVYLVLDDAGDADAPLAPLAQLAEDVRYIPSSGCSEVTDELPVYHVFVNALDVDADGVDEIQANLRVFDDLRHGVLNEMYAIDQEVLATPLGHGGSALSPATTAIEVADVNGNGRDEIIVFGQHTDQIVVWGLDGPSLETAEFREMLVLPTAFYNSQTRVFPIILPTNVDTDGVVLKYSDAEYRFVFTEPVLIAALAAAPCADGIGQNTDACTTAYGLSQSMQAGVDGTVTVSAGEFVSFEGKDPFFGIGVEGKASVTTTASFSASKSYTLTESVEYTTGGLEDTVIFTTLPIDQYTYHIVAHPDPELVGTTVVVNLPRTPVTLQVEREFYNASVVEGSMKVDASVFLHTVGDLDSYPTEGDADALISTGGLGHLGPLGDLVDSLGNPLIDALTGNGLKTSQAITVGQGTGQTSTEIVFTEESEYRAGAEIAYEAELAVTGGGVGVGSTVGGSVGAGLSWGSSNSTLYRGTIGSIDAENFADNLYSAGLFTYIYNYGNPDAPQFEVINYWVER